MIFIFWRWLNDDYLVDTYYRGGCSCHQGTDENQP